MPNQPQDPMAQSTNDYGPFTDALTGPLTPHSQAPPLTSTPSRGGAIATYLGKFLEGAQEGRRTQYERSEQNKREQEAAVYASYNRTMNDPTLSPEGKQAYRKAFEQGLAQKSQEVLQETEKGSKGKDPHPLLAMVKHVTNSILGPGENKKHKDLGSFALELQAIRNKPEYQIDPNAISADSISGSKPPAAAASPAQPAQQVPWANNGYLANKAPAAGTPTAAAAPAVGTPPPPGTTPAAAQAQGVPNLKSQAEAWDNDWFRGKVQDSIRKGQDWKATPLGDWFNSLPKVGTPKPTGSPQTIIDPSDPEHKRLIRVQGHLDPATGKTTYETIGEPAPVKATTTEINRQNLHDDMKKIHPEWSDAEVDKAVAKLDVDTATKKAESKLTDEDKLSRYLLDSGQAKTTEEAKKKSATMLVDLQNAKIKAAKKAGQAGSGGGGGAFTPAEMDALARWSIASGQQPNFGMGANNPSRTAYQKAVANIMLNGSIGDALAQKTDVKSLTSTLTNMQKMKANVGSFESAANKALDNALNASKAVPRDSSAMVNGWDQWITKHSVDDPKLQQLMVYTETAANEYARVIGSLTGASTNAARDQANSFIRSQLGEQSFEGAVQAMKTDMANRTGSIDETVKGLQDQVKAIGQPPSSGATGQRTAPPVVIKPEQREGDKSITEYQGHKIGQIWTNGKAITGFEKEPNGKVAVYTLP